MHGSPQTDSTHSTMAPRRSPQQHKHSWSVPLRVNPALVLWRDPIMDNRPRLTRQVVLLGGWPRRLGEGEDISMLAERCALLGGHQIPSDPQHVLKVVDPLPRVRSLPVPPSEIQIVVQAPL